MATGELWAHYDSYRRRALKHKSSSECDVLTWVLALQVLKMMVGSNLKDTQLQQIVDKTILFADKDEDGKIGFEEFCGVSCSGLRCIDRLS